MLGIYHIIGHDRICIKGWIFINELNINKYGLMSLRMRSTDLSSKVILCYLERSNITAVKSGAASTRLSKDYICFLILLYTYKATWMIESKHDRTFMIQSSKHYFSCLLLLINRVPCAISVINGCISWNLQASKT